MKEQGHDIHGNTTFPMVLREHLDSDYMHRKEYCANELPCDNKKELVQLKHLKMVKHNKATGPDNIKD